MEASPRRRESDSRRNVPGAGWVAFAGTLFLVLGFFNVIDGIVALAGDDHFSDELFFFGLTFWGIVMLLIGFLQLYTGYALFSGLPSGVPLGIFLAALNLIAQLFFLPAFPIWSVLIMVIDVMVIYGLTVYAEHFRRA